MPSTWRCSTTDATAGMCGFPLLPNNDGKLGICGDVKFAVSFFLLLLLFFWSNWGSCASSEAHWPRRFRTRVLQVSRCRPLLKSQVGCCELATILSACSVGSANADKDLRRTLRASLGWPSCNRQAPQRSKILYCLFIGYSSSEIVLLQSMRQA